MNRSSESGGVILWVVVLVVVAVLAFGVFQSIRDMNDAEDCARETDSAADC